MTEPTVKRCAWKTALCDNPDSTTMQGIRDARKEGYKPNADCDICDGYDTKCSRYHARKAKSTIGEGLR